MKYFQFLPSFEYSELAATNIMVRAKVREFVLQNSAVYYKHNIEDADRPDSLASRYYGNSNYTWLIFYANEIYDPFFDWPLSHQALISHLINKVGSLEIAKQTAHHYLLDDEYVIDQTTYNDVNIEASRKSIVSVYDHEMQKNEEKRSIILIDQLYVNQIVNEMKRLFL